MPGEDSGNGAVTNRRGESGDDGTITKLSPWSMADTLARLSAVAAARGLKVYSVIDHSGEARDVGLDLRDTKLVILGSPSVSTSVIEAARPAAVDLPWRVVVWEEAYQTFMCYPAPAAVARRYGLAGDLAKAFAGIETVISAVIDR